MTVSSAPIAAMSIRLCLAYESTGWTFLFERLVEGAGDAWLRLSEDHEKSEALRQYLRSSPGSFRIFD